MKQISKYIPLLLVTTLLASCGKFDEISTNPNATTKVTSSLLATGLLLDITSSSTSKSFIYDDLLAKQMAWGESMEDYQYSMFGRSGFGGYTTLINAQKMVESVTDDNVSAYGGLAHLIKTYKIFCVLMEMEDLPYEEALQGELGLVRPKYNTQKEVMGFVLSDLERVYELLFSAKDFDGDPILGGSISKWKKTTTAFQLKVLMHLSEKESDVDLNVKERFARTVTSGSLMESNDDNLQTKYADKANTVYPFRNTNTKHAGYAVLSTMLIDKFKATGDIRMFYYTKPAKARLDVGMTASSWDAHIGTDPPLPFEQIEKAYATEQYSGFNAWYTDYPSGELVVRLGYAEQNFILAGDAVRGWISGDATTYYKKAIRAYMEFIAANTPDEEIYHHGHPLTQETIAAFLETPAIQLSGEREGDLEKILAQRYPASFIQHPYGVYYDYRRTGYSILPISPATNRNTMNDRLPMRWIHPKSESDYDLEHQNEALQRQFGGVDDANKLMWILQ